MPKDHPCQVWFKLVEQFLQILIKMSTLFKPMHEKSMDDKCQSIQKGHSAFWPDVLNCNRYHNRNQYNHTNIRSNQKMINLLCVM